MDRESNQSNFAFMDLQQFIQNQVEVPEQEHIPLRDNQPTLRQSYSRGQSQNGFAAVPYTNNRSEGGLQLQNAPQFDLFQYNGRIKHNESIVNRETVQTNAAAEPQVNSGSNGTHNYIPYYMHHQAHQNNCNTRSSITHASLQCTMRSISEENITAEQSSGQFQNPITQTQKLQSNLCGGENDFTAEINEAIQSHMSEAAHHVPHVIGDHSQCKSKWEGEKSHRGCGNQNENAFYVVDVPIQFGNFEPHPIQNASTNNHAFQEHTSQRDCLQSGVQRKSPRPSQSAMKSKTNNEHINPKQDFKLAGMKIFATIMLHAWRRRQEHVRRLMDRVEELKMGAKKAREQVQLYNTLYHIEQERNEDLSSQLQNSIADSNKTRLSCEDLSTGICSLKADNDLLRQELNRKIEDVEALSALLAQTKSDLFRAMGEQCKLQTSLSKEQRKSQILESQKDKLVQEVCSLTCANRNLEEQTKAQLQNKDAELKEALEKAQNLELRIEKLGIDSWKYSETVLNEKRLQKEIEELKETISAHQSQICLNGTQINLQKMIRKTIFIQKYLLQLAHVFVYHLLPAFPQPKSLKIQFRYLES